MKITTSQLFPNILRIIILGVIALILSLYSISPVPDKNLPQGMSKQDQINLKNSVLSSLQSQRASSTESLLDQYISTLCGIDNFKIVTVTGTKAGTVLPSSTVSAAGIRQLAPTVCMNTFVGNYKKMFVAQGAGTNGSWFNTSSPDGNISIYANTKEISDLGQDVLILEERDVMKIKGEVSISQFKIFKDSMLKKSSVTMTLTETKPLLDKSLEDLQKQYPKSWNSAEFQYQM
ncbi:MAG: hypothetical protein WCO48_00955 [Candidatus Taylorbacteria bacterium]